jgi:hypothetical protein
MSRALMLCTLWSATLFLGWPFAPAAKAQSVWSGFDVQFSKPLFADPTAPENQDRITDNVWITRGTNQGLFNASVEAGFTEGTSPQNTEWATALIAANAGEEIAAANWADLTFDDWVNAYGGAGTMLLPSRLLANNAVVHLIMEDIYLDLRITEWSGAGGAFAYERAMGTIMPPASTGDYNGNDVVDAADYVVWRETLGQAVAMNGDGADGNRNGTVEPDDYNVWRMNFGRVFAGAASGTSQFASMPEPTTIGLSFAALLALGRRLRKRFHD